MAKKSGLKVCEAKTESCLFYKKGTAPIMITLKRKEHNKHRERNGNQQQ